jgi:hypothetical protein
MSFVVFVACNKDYEAHWKKRLLFPLFLTLFPPTVVTRVTMEFSRRQSLEKVLNKIAEASIQDLSSCSSQLLQKVRDKVSRIITRDQATESTSRSAITQARQWVPRKGTTTISDFSTSQLVTQPKITQECADVADGGPTPVPPPERSDINDRASGFVDRVLQNITHISEFLKRDVETILRDGIRQSHEDPRIEDVGKMVETTELDELRFILGCLSLGEDYDRFAKAPGKKTKQGSQRAFAATLGVEESCTNKIRYGIVCGNKIKKLARGFGYGIVGLLVFVRWHRAREEDMARFGRLCVAKKAINDLIPGTAIFMTNCAGAYQTVVHERRLGNHKQPIPRKRKRPVTDDPAAGHHNNKFQQPSQCTADLSIRPNSTDQLPSTNTEEVSIGKKTLVPTSRLF